MSNTSRRKPPPTTTTTAPEPEPGPEPADEPADTRVTVSAPLAIAGLFERGQTRTVERTKFVENLINNGKLVVQE